MGKSKKLDPSEVLARISSLVQEGGEVQQALGSLVNHCARSGGNLDGRAIQRLPVADELGRLERWFATVWAPKAPPKTYDGLWFGIIETSERVHDLYVAALPQTGEKPAEWTWARPRYAKPQDAQSTVLSALLAPEGCIRDPLARHLIGLGYAALAAAHLCRVSAAVLGREPLVAVGYDEGDFLVLGVVRKNATFERLAPAKEEMAATPVALPKGNLLRMRELRKGSNWYLAEPTNGGQPIPFDFATEGRRIKDMGPYTVPIYSEGEPLDVSFSIGEVPIVRQGVAELIEKVSPKSVQRIPARIEGVRASYEILNIVANVRPKGLLDRAKAAGTPVGSGDLGRHRLARVGSAIVVARELAAALADSHVTGIRFESLKGTDLK